MTGQCSALQNEMSDTVGVIFLFFNGDKRKPSVTSLHCVKHNSALHSLLSSRLITSISQSINHPSLTSREV